MSAHVENLAYHAAHDQAAWVSYPADCFYMHGDDAVAVLHKLCSNDIDSLAPNQYCEAFSCTVQGKVVGHFWATRVADGVRIDTAPQQAEKLISHFDRYVIREDVRFSDESDQRRTVIILGPSAGQCIGDLAEVDFSSTDAESGTWIDLGGVQARDFEHGRGWLLTGPAADIATWQAKLKDAAPDATAAWEALRIEAGLPQYGQDISENNLPQEVQRNESALSFTKGCYLGQEPVARIDAMGRVNWMLMGLQGLGEQSATPWQSGTEFYAGDKVAAKVTSSALSPGLGLIALAYVRRTQAEPGAQLALSADDSREAAEVVTLPMSAS